MDKFIMPLFQSIRLEQKATYLKRPSSNNSHKKKNDTNANISSLQIETIDRNINNFNNINSIEDKSHIFLSKTGNKYFSVSDNFSAIPKSPHRVNLKGIQNIFHSINRLNQIIERKSKYGYEIKINNPSIAKNTSSLMIENSNNKNKNTPIFCLDQTPKVFIQQITDNTYLEKNYNNIKIANINNYDIPYQENAFIKKKNDSIHVKKKNPKEKLLKKQEEIKKFEKTKNEFVEDPIQLIQVKGKSTLGINQYINSFNSLKETEKYENKSKFLGSHKKLLIPYSFHIGIKPNNNQKKSELLEKSYNSKINLSSIYLNDEKNHSIKEDLKNFQDNKSLEDIGNIKKQLESEAVIYSKSTQPRISRENKTNIFQIKKNKIKNFTKYIDKKFTNINIVQKVLQKSPKNWNKSIMKHQNASIVFGKPKEFNINTEYRKEFQKKSGFEESFDEENKCAESLKSISYENNYLVSHPIKVDEELFNFNNNNNKSELDKHFSRDCLRQKPLINYSNFKNIYTYVIGYGNHSTLVRKIMEKRNNDWKEVPYIYNSYHFKWVPYSSAINYSILSTSIDQAVNHFEFNNELTTKDYLFKNLTNYCQLNKLNVFDYTPLTFVLDLEDKSFNSDIEKFSSCFNLIKSELSNLDKEDPLHRHKLIEAINSKLSNFGISRDRRIISHCKLKMHDSHLLDKNIWLLKPTGFNRGRGVVIFDSLEELKKLIKDYSEGREEDYSNKGKNDNIEFISKFWEIAFGIEEEEKSCPHIEIIKSKTFVVQKYVEQPLLIHNRKFDIRIWVLLNQEMKVYVFKEGYIRTSSEEFNLDSGNRAIHLTNNAIQKISQKYGEFEEGNQLSFQMFQEYLNTHYPEEKICFRDNLFKQIKQIILLTMQSVRRRININNRNICFELFGYDFFVDFNFKVWLIEVNTNPCLEESSQILKNLIPRLIDDTFKLTIDQIYPPKRKKEKANDNNYPVEGYYDYENLWEFLIQINQVPKFEVIKKKQKSSSEFHYKFNISNNKKAP